MTLNEYQRSAYSYSLDSARNINYLLLGLSGEVGELQSIFAKHVRDGGVIDWNNVKKELGDVLWFVASLAEFHGFTLDGVAQANLDKLKSRKQRGTIGGSGDER